MELYNYPEKDLMTELILENKNNKIELRGKNFKNIIINYSAKIFVFSGKILEDDLMVNELLKWSMISSEKKEHLMDMTIKIVRNGYVVREIKINNVYVISHDEDYTTKTYSIAISQHNKRINSKYTVVPLNTDSGRVYALVQPRDDLTTKILNSKVFKNITLGLNTAGSMAILNTSKEGIKDLVRSGLNSGVKGSLLLRFNIFYLAAHGGNLVISTSSDLYFKSIGYEEAIGKVNPLRDIYEEVSVLGFKILSKFTPRKFNEEKARKKGRDVYYFADIAGAIIGLAGTTAKISNSAKYGKKIAYTVKINETAGTAARQYKASYIMVSGGVISRDINPLIQNGIGVKENVK